MKIPINYYQSNEVVALAKDLIGKVLCTLIDQQLTAGIISETEAYAGRSDRASHAYNGRFTQRTSVMYKPGGRSYVYLCYGVHYLFNIVTGPENQPHAVLIRGIIPYKGREIMESRLGKSGIDNRSTNGPGKLSKALGIDLKMNDIMLDSNIIWIEDKPAVNINKKIISTPRIGVDYAGEDAKLPYRFLLK